MVFILRGSGGTWKVIIQGTRVPGAMLRPVRSFDDHKEHSLTDGRTLGFGEITRDYRKQAIHYKVLFTRQVQEILTLLETKILPAFENIEAQAEELIDNFYENYLSSPEGEGYDIAEDEAAEVASKAGLDYYLTQTAFHQALLNLFAVALRHLFEQQAKLFLRGEMLQYTEGDKKGLFEFKEFDKRLRGSGIDVRTFKCWSVLEELRRVANTVKHAEGRSEQDLREQNPRLFTHPELRAIPLRDAGLTGVVFTPLMGEDVYVELHDLKRYADGVAAFWRELAGGPEPG